MNRFSKGDQVVLYWINGTSKPLNVLEYYFHNGRWEYCYDFEDTSFGCPLTVSAKVVHEIGELAYA